MKIRGNMLLFILLAVFLSTVMTGCDMDMAGLLGDVGNVAGGAGAGGGMFDDLLGMMDGLPNLGDALGKQVGALGNKVEVPGGDFPKEFENLQTFMSTKSPKSMGGGMVTGDPLQGLGQQGQSILSTDPKDFQGVQSIPEIPGVSGKGSFATVDNLYINDGKGGTIKIPKDDPRYQEYLGNMGKPEPPPPQKPAAPVNTPKAPIKSPIGVSPQPK